jgi:hypothetical protein
VRSTSRSGWKWEARCGYGNNTASGHAAARSSTIAALRGKAAEGRRSPGRWREFLRLPTTRSVLECASPLALSDGELLRAKRPCNRACPDSIFQGWGGNGFGRTICAKRLGVRWQSGSGDTAFGPMMNFGISMWLVRAKAALRFASRRSPRHTVANFCDIQRAKRRVNPCAVATMQPFQR